MADPLDDARTLLALARVLFRARRHAARRGIQPAAAATRRAEPLGRRLADAVARAEAGDEAALEEVVRVGEELAADLEAWESIQGLVGELLRGVGGDRPLFPGR